jgi:uncharacterized protein YggE
MKNSLKIYIAIGTFALFQPLISQQQAQVSPIKTIDISESSEMQVNPNKITVKIVLKERTEDKNQQPISIKIQEDSLRLMLKKMKIDASKLTVVNMSTTFESVRKRKDAVSIKVLNLELSKYSDQNLIFQKLDKWKVFNAYVEKYEHTQYDSLVLEMKKLALMLAKNNAKLILKGIGEELLSPLEIRYEQVYLSDNISPMLSMMKGSSDKMDMIEKDDDKEESQPLELGKIKIKSNVFVKFQIK